MEFPKYFRTYIYILWRNHQWDKALAVCNGLKDSLVGEGKPTTEMEKQIAEIKSYKVRYDD